MHNPITRTLRCPRCEGQHARTRHASQQQHTGTPCPQLGSPWKNMISSRKKSSLGSALKTLWRNRRETRIWRPEATVDDSAKLNCWFPWTPRLESRVGHGRELSEYGQRPLVRPVPVGLDQLCGQVAQHSCPCSVCSQINYIIEIENSFNQLA